MCLPLQEMQVRFLGQEDLLEREMATHSSYLLGKSHGQRSLAGYSSWDHRRVRYNLLTKQSINKFYLFTVRVETILGTIITTNITMSNYSVFVISLLLSVRFMFSCCCLVCFNLKNSNISRVIREAGWS